MLLEKDKEGISFRIFHNILCPILIIHRNTKGFTITGQTDRQTERRTDRKTDRQMQNDADRQMTDM